MAKKKVKQPISKSSMKKKPTEKSREEYVDGSAPMAPSVSAPLRSKNIFSQISQVELVREKTLGASSNARQILESDVKVDLAEVPICGADESGEVHVAPKIRRLTFASIRPLRNLLIGIVILFAIVIIKEMWMPSSSVLNHKAAVTTLAVSNEIAQSPRPSQLSETASGAEDEALAIGASTVPTPELNSAELPLPKLGLEQKKEADIAFDQIEIKPADGNYYIGLAIKNLGGNVQEGRVFVIGQFESDDGTTAYYASPKEVEVDSDGNVLNPGQGIRYKLSYLVQKQFNLKAPKELGTLKGLKLIARSKDGSEVSEVFSVQEQVKF